MERIIAWEVEGRNAGQAAGKAAGRSAGQAAGQDASPTSAKGQWLLQMAQSVLGDSSTCVVDFPATGATKDRAAAFCQGTLGAPVEPRLAATVMLVRDHPAQGMEVFMMRRASTMAFVPDAVVFPGGGADKVDVGEGSLEATWAGTSPAEWAQRLGCDQVSAAKVVTAAIREVFEETGVLLASSAAAVNQAAAVDQTAAVDQVIPLVAQEERFWTLRQEVESRRLPFRRFLEQEGLVIRTDLLNPVAHWITPACEPRRYNTYFFTAQMPECQVAKGANSESVEAGWVTPCGVLSMFARDEALLMPPTIVNLMQLSRARCAGEALELPMGQDVLMTPVELAAGEYVMRGVIR